MDSLITQKTTIGELKSPDILVALAEELMKSPDFPFKEVEQVPLVRKFFIADVTETKAKDPGLKDGQIAHVINTAAVDRDREIVMPMGGDLKAYRKNPIVLWSHNYFEPENIIGKNIRIERNDEMIRVVTQFYMDGMKSSYIYGLYKDEYLRAWSIGFVPLKGREPEEDDMKAVAEGDKDRLRWIHERWALLEYSAVAVPSNPEALTDSVAKGMKLSDDLLEELAIKLNDIDLGGKDGKNKTTIDLGGNKDGKPEEGDETKTPEEGDTKTEPAGDFPEVDYFDDGLEPPADYKEMKQLLKTLESEVAELKEGRVLSAKNRKVVSDAVAAMRAAGEALEALLAATEENSEDGKDFGVNLDKILSEAEKKTADAIDFDDSVTGLLK